MNASEAYAAALAPRNKYGARKVRADGYTFDSKAEYERYLVLRDMVAHREILELEVHPVVELQGRAKDFAGRNVAPIRWVLDFAYYDREGKHWYEDVKGVRTAAYGLKRRMFLARFTSVCFREVDARRRGR